MVSYGVIARVPVGSSTVKHEHRLNGQVNDLVGFRWGRRGFEGCFTESLDYFLLRHLRVAFEQTRCVKNALVRELLVHITVLGESDQEVIFLVEQVIQKSEKDGKT